MQALRRSTQDHGSGHLRMQWASLVDSQSRMDQMVNFVVCSGAALAQDEWTAKRQRRARAAFPADLGDDPLDYPLEDPLEDPSKRVKKAPKAARTAKTVYASAPKDTVFAKYKDVEPLSKKKLKKRWKKHERDLETVGFLSQLDAKKTLSMLFNASIVVAPLFIKDGEITDQKVRDLAANARQYKDDLGKEKSLGAKAEKLKNDFMDRLDENLVSQGAKMGLTALGFGRDAGVLSTLVGQVVTKGTKGINPTELAEEQVRNNPNIVYTAAQLAMRTLTGEKTETDAMRKALRDKEAELKVMQQERDKVLKSQETQTVPTAASSKNPQPLLTAS
jgi:hypothetical protein